MSLNKRRLLIISFSLATSVIIIMLLLYLGIIRFNYPSLTQFPIQGVDVSHHQGSIDWLQLKSPSIRFAYIKASEGATFKDAEFKNNWQGAVTANVVPGSYHFFTLCKSAREQANNFISAAAWSKTDGLPPAVDLEFGGNCSKLPSRRAFHRQLQLFLQIIENEWGCRPVLYVTREFYDYYDISTYSAYPLWLRNIFKKPNLGTKKPWQLWQFANRARLPGVNTYIDLNAFNGGSDQFTRFHCRKPDNNQLEN